MKSTVCDAVIVGGGIVGAACAWAFAREKMKVMLIEAHTVGGGATASGMGHVSIMGDGPAQFALTKYSQSLWHELAGQLPPVCQCENRAALWIAADREEMDVLLQKKRFCTANGITVEILDAAELAEAEPNLRSGMAGGLLLPGDMVVHPPCVAKYLVETACKQGAHLQTGAEVKQIEQGRVRLSDGSTVSAGIIVNATGTRASELMPGLPIRPRKGHLAITGRYPEFLHHQLIECGYLKGARSDEAEAVAFNVQPRAPARW